MTETLPADWEHTEAELTLSCQLDDGDQRCDQPATHILEWAITGREPLHILACSDHADAAQRHHDRCRPCARMFRLTVETIGRPA
jgi:hypothetical protein